MAVQRARSMGDIAVVPHGGGFGGQSSFSGVWGGQESPVCNHFVCPIVAQFYCHREGL